MWLHTVSIAGAYTLQGQLAPLAHAGRRIAWLDAAKGLSIILVVFGHVFPPPLGTSIAVLRMPFFFFLSGYIFTARPWPDFLWKRGNSLLVPYCAYLLLIVATSRLLASWDGGLDPFSMMPPLALAKESIKGGSHLYGCAGALWFLTTLFFTLTVYNLILRTSSVDGRAEATSPRVMIPVLVLLAIGCALEHRQTYLGIGIAPIALFFVWAGSAFRSILIPGWVFLPALIIFVVAVWAGLNAYPDVVFDMRIAAYGLPFLSLLGSIAGCYIAVTACRVASRLTIVRDALSSVGTNSIVIMALHLSVAIRLKAMTAAPTILILLLSVLIPYFIALALRRGHWIVRWLFLGEPPAKSLAPKSAVRLVRRWT